MNKAALAEAGAGSPPFYFSERKIVPSEVEGHVLRQAQDRIFRKILKGLEVRGERWEEFLIFHIVPLIFIKMKSIPPFGAREGSDLEIGVLCTRTQTVLSWLTILS